MPHLSLWSKDEYPEAVEILEGAFTHLGRHADKLMITRDGFLVRILPQFAGHDWASGLRAHPPHDHASIGLLADGHLVGRCGRCLYHGIQLVTPEAVVTYLWPSFHPTHSTYREFLICQYCRKLAVSRLK